MMIQKICTKCRQKKSLDDFYRDKSQKDGRDPKCKICRAETVDKWQAKNKKRCRENAKKWQRKNKKHVRNCRLEKRFGITSGRYDEMYVDQGGGCAICGRHQSEFKRRLAVHHDHITKEVPALLCPDCNTLLGRIEKAEKTGLMDKINAFRKKQSKLGENDE